MRPWYYRVAAVCGHRNEIPRRYPGGSPVCRAGAFPDRGFGLAGDFPAAQGHRCAVAGGQPVPGDRKSQNRNAGGCQRRLTATMTSLEDISVTQLKGVGNALAGTLAKLGIHSVQDLLFHLPHRYEDRTRVIPMGSLRIGDVAVVERSEEHTSELQSRPHL